METIHLWRIVRAQVKRVEAEHAELQYQKQLIALADKYKAMAATPQELIASVMGYVRLLDRPFRASHARPAPYPRTEVAETAHVIMLGWSNERAINRWIYERNLFWQAGQTHS